MAKSGDELLNPATGQRLRILRSSEEMRGDLLEMEATFPAASEEPPEHLHPIQEEDYRVVSGSIRVRINGQERRLAEGDRLIVPPGIPHAVWNAGLADAEVRWLVKPALRTEAFLETLFRLGREGKVDDRGLPGLLHWAVLVWNYRQEIRLTTPPEPLGTPFFALLAAIGKLRGFRPD